MSRDYLEECPCGSGKGTSAERKSQEGKSGNCKPSSHPKANTCASLTTMKGDPTMSCHDPAGAFL
jgi:hypothetical protein